jgi:serine/threonine-protein kinase
MVALKFLPASLQNDAAALAGLHAEVRNARQVSHPNVCRVYDIGEVNGQHFLTMEYIDGEDLASLLRRIGPPTRRQGFGNRAPNLRWSGSRHGV